MVYYEYLDNFIQNLQDDTLEATRQLEAFLKEMGEDNRRIAVGKRALKLHSTMAKFLVEISKI